MPIDGCIETQEWIDGEITDRCPVMWVSEYNSGFEAYTWSEKGVMPLGDGWLREPAVFMEVISIINDEVTSHRMREVDRNGGN